MSLLRMTVVKTFLLTTVVNSLLLISSKVLFSVLLMTAVNPRSLNRWSSLFLSLRVNGGSATFFNLASHVHNCCKPQRHMVKLQAVVYDILPPRRKVPESDAGIVMPESDARSVMPESDARSVRHYCQWINQHQV